MAETLRARNRNPGTAGGPRKGGRGADPRTQRVSGRASRSCAADHRVGSGRDHVPQRRHTTRLAVAWGFAEVLSNKVTILAESSERASEIDVARAQQAKQRAEEILRSHAPDTNYKRRRTPSSAPKRASRWRKRADGKSAWVYPRHCPQRNYPSLAKGRRANLGHPCRSEPRENPGLLVSGRSRARSATTGAAAIRW